VIKLPVGFLLNTQLVLFLRIAIKSQNLPNNFAASHSKKNKNEANYSEGELRQKDPLDGSLNVY